MRAGKWASAILAAFAIIVATNWLIHAVLLRAEYQAIVLSFRPMQVIRARMWIVLVGQAVFSVAFVYIYTRGLESKPWPAQGVRYGILAWLLTVVPASLAEFVTMYLPHRLVLQWIGYGLAQLVLAGLVVAAIVGERPVAR
ncbi:MAG TPA: hypothetical protein VNJ12_00940 [Candidatus Dormibacteraeota bacterium]|nr:hypothetical protein [Candidatus Dormibacteraeota bacterium]